MKYTNIVVAGDVGTGTTTLAKSLAQRLNFTYISTGDYFRQYAKEHNIPLWDKSSVPDSVDQEIDKKFTEKMKNEAGFVFDTHYGGYFTRDMDHVFKILLTCDPKTSEDRILNRDHTHKETVEDIKKRRAENLAKFHKLYSKESPENPEYFNLIIDTTQTSAEDTLNQSLQAIN